MIKSEHNYFDNQRISICFTGNGRPEDEQWHPVPTAAAVCERYVNINAQINTFVHP
jgi:hypothetical protein